MQSRGHLLVGSSCLATKMKSTCWPIVSWVRHFKFIKMEAHKNNYFIVPFLKWSPNRYVSLEIYVEKLLCFSFEQNIA